MPVIFGKWNIFKLYFASKVNTEGSWTKMKENRDSKSTRAIVTVLGEDKIGIIAAVTNILADNKVNILDISQTIMQEFFTMIMVCDLARSTVDFAALSDQLDAKGKEMELQVRIQHEDVFRFMHRI